MMHQIDTTAYDRLPLSVIIYETVKDAQGAFSDYRLIYGNTHFAKDYQKIYGEGTFLGKQAARDGLADSYTLHMMDLYRDNRPQSFSTYMPHGNLHVHMEPLCDLPEGLLGFIVTDIEDYDEQEARGHFLHAVAQMNNNACLFRQNEDGSLTAVYVSPNFCEMMECSSVIDGLQLMDGTGFWNSIHPEDVPLVREMLKNHCASNGSTDLSIRLISVLKNAVWCTVHYAFIDEYKEHFIYCTYADVTVFKKYEARLQSVYTNLGNNFHKTDTETLIRMRANLTQDLVEELGGSSPYSAGIDNLSFSQALARRSTYFPIEKEREEFKNTFSIPSLIRSYMDGQNTKSRVLYTRLPDNSVAYVKCTSNVTRHPLTGDLMAFITEESNNPEKLASTIQEKILARQFDLVAYIARDIYDVAIGDRIYVRHGYIFPKERHGSYTEYLETQIIPALKKDEAYRQEIRDAMSLETVFKMFEIREPYSVDIELEIEDGIFYTRFDFYSVDPESEYCIVLKTDTTELIREQKKQEEKARELEHSKEQLADAEEIIAEAGFGMWHIVLEDGKAPRMRGNEKMMALLGITGQDLTEEEIYESWYSRIYPEDIPSVQKSLAEMIEGKVSENTYRWEHPLKGQWYVRCGGAAKALENHRTLLRGYHIDVTDIVRDDMAKKEALSSALAAAEHANRAKTVFLNNMSHDIRTPMNAIVGFTALAASHIHNTEQVKDYLSKISVSSQHLLSLINDVLDMSRIESGKMTLDESQVHLPDMIHDLRTIIQANITAKQLELFIDTQNVVNEDIITDKLRLNQVFLNILSNAIKFTPSGGNITFRVIEKPALSAGMTTFEFRIKDTGIGMSEAFQKTIFDAFTREKTSTVSGIQGTGLGMAITKNIIDMMGGTIYVNSKVGEGTEFVVDIPCKICGTAAGFDRIPELTGLRALVADDDTNTCLSVCAMLREIGLRPDWTNYGKESVIRAKEALAQKDPFSVYIIDWMMPDMNGIETVRRIRKVVGDEAPIIILTAYDWTDIEEEAREAGVTGFCSKPLFMSELRNVLAKPFSETEENTPEETVKIDFSGRHILLAEDNEMNQMIAEAILTEAGFTVDIACDGSIAVEKMAQHEAGFYDIILMDIQMPNMDGYEAAARIRQMADPAKAAIPIVAVTANAFEEDRKLALEAGMNGHLAKPYDIPAMMETLTRLLKN